MHIIVSRMVETTFSAQLALFLQTAAVTPAWLG